MERNPNNTTLLRSGSGTGDMHVMETPEELLAQGERGCNQRQRRLAGTNAATNEQAFIPGSSAVLRRPLKNGGRRPKPTPFAFEFRPLLEGRRPPPRPLSSFFVSPETDLDFLLIEDFFASLVIFSQEAS
jgi:hypothetical protein